MPDAKPPCTLTIAAEDRERVSHLLGDHAAYLEAKAALAGASGWGRAYAQRAKRLRGYVAQLADVSETGKQETT